MQLFKIIKLNKFMTQYAPTVRQWRNKNAGFNGRKAITYTEADIKAIKAGLKQLLVDLKKMEI